MPPLVFQTKPNQPSVLQGGESLQPYSWIIAKAIYKKRNLALSKEREISITSIIELLPYVWNWEHDRNMKRNKEYCLWLTWQSKIHTYLTTTSTVGCSMRKKEGDIWTNLTWPFLEFLLSSKTTTKLICGPQGSCSIAAPTTKPCPSGHIFV